MKNTIITTSMDELKHEADIVPRDPRKNSEENESISSSKTESQCTVNCTLCTDTAVSVLESEHCGEKAQIVIKNELDTQTVTKYEKDEHITIVKCDPDSSSKSTSQAQNVSENDEDSIRQSIVNLIEDVFHAFICRNVSCTRTNCRKMKWILLHSKSCRGHCSNQRCVSCKHLFMLLSYHAHICEESAPSLKCKLLRCNNFKIYLEKVKSIQQRMNKVRNEENQNSSGMLEMSVSSTSISTSLSMSEPSMSINNDDTIIIKPERDSIVNPHEDIRPI